MLFLQIISDTDSCSYDFLSYTYTVYMVGMAELVMCTLCACEKVYTKCCVGERVSCRKLNSDHLRPRCEEVICWWTY